jgi:uncharacterized SAM-binding protein YcdF (DUF218 family)
VSNPDHVTNEPTDDHEETRSGDPIDPIDRSGRAEVERAEVERAALPWWRRPRPSRIIAGVVGVIVVYYLVSLVQVVQAGRADHRDPVDAIVVLGAAQYDGRPSPQLQARLDHAITLWDGGVAPLVMVTGGKLPGDRFTEAEASQRYLVASGVPETSILMENVGRTTYGSLESASELLLAAGLDDVVLVSDPFHMKRAELIADGLGLDARVSSTPTSVVTGWSSARRHAQEAAGVALGRLVGFERLSELTG